MRLILMAAIAALTMPLAAAAQDDDVSEEAVARIDEVLAGMQCQMDPDDIELTDEGGYDLDDVMCADGQYDIELNADFEETNRRAE